MAAADKKREELLDFLDRKVFDPILSASPADYKSEHEKQILVDVKRKTESEKHRFHENYRTAEKLRKTSRMMSVPGVQTRWTRNLRN